MWLVRFLLPLILSTSSIVPVVLVQAVPIGTPAAPAPFRRGTCAQFHTSPYTGYCGYLVVPEDRAKPDGRQVQLTVVVFKRLSPARHSDPIIYLSGGPGDALVSTVGRYLAGTMLDSYIGNRDLILVDQRGTGLSRPSPACPEVNREALQVLATRLSRARADALTLRAVQACHDRLVRAGINLGAYNTLADAADIAAVGPALGYRHVDLYGLSYGTLPAQTVLRLAPTGIRSVILDSVVPVQSNLYSLEPTSMAHVFGLVFAACAGRPACRRAYPHLATTLAQVVRRLNDAPATITVSFDPKHQHVPALLTGDELTYLAFRLLYSSQTNGQVPALIASAARGTYAPAAQIYGYALTTSEPQVNSLGVFLTDLCSEDAPFTTPAQITLAVQALPPALRAIQLDAQLTGVRECGIWQVPSVPAWQKTAVHSAVPTLLLTGQYDPITPPALGRQVARTLPHSFFFTFPGRGHGQDFDPEERCPDLISREFLQWPTQKPDTRCIQTMTPLAFQ